MCVHGVFIAAKTVSHSLLGFRPGCLFCHARRRSLSLRCSIGPDCAVSGLPLFSSEEAAHVFDVLAISAIQVLARLV